MSESREVDDEVLTVIDAAKLLRVGRNAFYDAVGRGELPHLRVGKQIRFLSRRADASAYFAGDERSPPSVNSSTRRSQATVLPTRRVRGVNPHDATCNDHNVSSSSGSTCRGSTWSP